MVLCSIGAVAAALMNILHFQQYITWLRVVEDFVPCRFSLRCIDFVFHNFKGKPTKNEQQLRTNKKTQTRIWITLELPLNRCGNSKTLLANISAAQVHRETSEYGCRYRLQRRFHCTVCFLVHILQSALHIPIEPSMFYALNAFRVHKNNYSFLYFNRCKI